MVHSGLDAMDIRRIEAAILNSGSDFDCTMNPYQAGLDAFVDMKKADFIGKAALAVADRRPMLHGVRCADAEPLILGPAMQSGEAIGLVTAGAWSPYLQCGIGYVRWRIRRTSRASGSRSSAWTERRTRRSASNSLLRQREEDPARARVYDPVAGLTRSAGVTREPRAAPRPGPRAARRREPARWPVQTRSPASAGGPSARPRSRRGRRFGSTPASGSRTPA